MAAGTGRGGREYNGVAGPGNAPGRPVKTPTGGRAAVMGAAALGGALALTASAVTPAAALPGHHGGGERHRAPVVRYVALGGSYTSGPAIPTQVDANCARSDHNYPSLVAAADRIDHVTDVSCSGATTAEMWQTQGTNPPQLDALDRKTTLVTVQIGGNDVGFGSIIATCAKLGAADPTGNPCERHYGATGTDQLTAAVVNTAPKIAKVLRAVHVRAPRARVVLVGYPDLLPDDGVPCTSPVVPFAAGDFRYLRDTEKKVNTMLRVEALLGGARYVDTYRPTVGHDMCRAPADRWIEPLVPASPAAPAHPNAEGEQAMAQAVLRTVGTRGDGHRR